MPRKQSPVRHMSRVYIDIPVKLNESSVKRLEERLGDKAAEFLPIASSIISRYKNRVRVYNLAPKLGEIRASLNELSNYAEGLSYGVQSLDSDTFEFIHHVLLTESPCEREVLDIESMDLADLENPEKMESVLSSDSVSQWDAIQELMDQVKSEMYWVGTVVDNALELVNKNNKPGPQPMPLHWLAEKTISCLRQVGVTSLTTTKGGDVEEVMKILLEESGYLGRDDLHPEICAAFKKLQHD